jgi:predicted nucleic acid-binding protein
MKAVFNSSPIIFLTKLGIIEPALGLFERIDIPSLVYSEIRQQQDASAEAVEDLIRRKRVSVLKSENERFVNALNRRLGKGEAEAIA